MTTEGAMEVDQQLSNNGFSTEDIGYKYVLSRFFFYQATGAAVRLMDVIEVNSHLSYSTYMTQA